MTTNTTPAAKPAQQQNPTSTAMVVNSTMREPASITAALKRAVNECHLISPATACGALPEGFSVALSSVVVDVDRDTYDTKGGGKRGLHRHVLDRIASAAAVSWDSQRSRRLDDGRDPRYCLFQAVGHYRHFDGTLIEIVGTKEMDLRDGSAQIAGKSPKEIAMQRSHIVAHCETKSRLRAIAAMGVKRAYTAEELKKPFVVARLMFDGRSEDPELRREFAKMQAQAFIGSHTAMYGRAPEQRISLPAPTPAPPLPAASVEEDDEPPISDPPVDLATEAPAVQP